MQAPITPKRTLAKRQFQYSGLMVTSFLLAALLPFGIAPSGGARRGKGDKRDGKKGGRKRQRERERQVDDEPHDLDNKSCKLYPSPSFPNRSLLYQPPNK